jgi:hypothetical protein
MTKHDFVEYSPQLQKSTYSGPKTRYTLVFIWLCFNWHLFCFSARREAKYIHFFK